MSSSVCGGARVRCCNILSDVSTYLVVARAEDKLGVRVVIKYALHNLALRGEEHRSMRTNQYGEQIADIPCSQPRGGPQGSSCRRGLRNNMSNCEIRLVTNKYTFNRPLAGEVVLEQILALATLE